MPGIIGCIKKTGLKSEVETALVEICHNNSCVNNEIYEDENVICGSNHLGIITLDQESLISSKGFSFIHGEVYNKSEVFHKFSLVNKNFANAFVEALEKELFPDFLRFIDGHFNAVIYQKSKKLLHFISSRYGFKPLYIWHDDRHLAWGSELKIFRNFKMFDPIVDKEAIHCFLDLSQFLGDRTWFKNVHQLDASTWLTFSLEDGKEVSKIRYWSWSLIPKVKINFQDAVHQTGILFKKAVAKRCKPENLPYTIALSGGLDSRAVLAAIPNNIKLNAFTFGTKNCEDVRIARQLVNICNIDHEHLILNDDNWLKGRVEGIWKSDGMMSFIHHHAVQYESLMRQMGTICFNGFAGDVVLNNNWLRNFNHRVTKERAELEFKHWTYLSPPSDSFYDIETEAPYYLDTRVRRFTTVGINAFKSYETRIPFFDNNLIEFVFSLDECFKMDNKLYKSMLLKFFPRSFEKIRWQQSGYPISDYNKTYYQTRRILLHYKSNYFSDTINFAQYSKWIIQKKKNLQKILNSKDSILQDVLGQKIKITPNTWNEINKITTLITAEIWLQQIFHNSFLKTEDLLNIDDYQE